MIHCPVLFFLFEAAAAQHWTVVLLLLALRWSRPRARDLVVTAAEWLTWLTWLTWWTEPWQWWCGRTRSDVEPSAHRGRQQVLVHTRGGRRVDRRNAA